MERIVYISRTQTFAVLLVALGHCTPANNDVLLTNPYWIWFTSFFCSSFDMPLFMFFSGFLYARSAPKKTPNYLGFIGQKTFKMLVPYFVLGTIGFAIKLVLSKFALRPVAYSFMAYLNGFIYPWQNPVIYLWFLPTLLIIYMILFPMKYIKNKVINGILFFILVVLNVAQPFADVAFLNIGGVLQYLVYFATGFYFYALQPKFSFLNSIPALMLSAVVLVTLNLYSVRALLEPVLTKSGNALLLAFTGILFSLSLGHLLSKKMFSSLAIYDGLYFCTYLLSWFVITGVKIGYQLNFFGQVVCILLTMFLILIIPLLAKKYIHQKFAKTVIGLR